MKNKYEKGIAVSQWICFFIILINTLLVRAFNVIDWGQFIALSWFTLPVFLGLAVVYTYRYRKERLKEGDGQ